MIAETPPPRVLIVEDNPTNLLLVETILRRAGYRTDAARTAEEVMGRIASARPDLILMDLQLPGQDGLSLTRQLKANVATSAIPIVALTAHAMKDDRARALSAGCDGYIAKPINTRSLVDQIEAIVPGLRLARPRVERRDAEAPGAAQGRADEGRPDAG